MKRQRVPNVPYSPPLPAIKKTISNKKRNAKNKTVNNKDKASDVCNAKTQQLTTILSSSSEHFSDEDRSQKSNDNCAENNTIIAHDLTQHQSITQSAHNSTIATLLRRLEEMEKTNTHLHTLLKKKRALSPSSSGIESLGNEDNENIHAEFENRTCVSTDSTRKQLKDVTDTYQQIKQNKASFEAEPRNISQKKSCKDTHSNILQHNSLESPFVHSQNEVESEREPNITNDIEEPLADTPRQLHQLYGKDFNGETMILLGNDIFCKSLVLHYALGSSSKTTHLVRKLVLGVFKEEIFKKGPHQVTLTGYSPRNIGKQTEIKYDNIDIIARFTIIKYAKAIGKLKKWPYVRTKDLERTLSQRIGELKREAK
ncbi:uncharacterized protein [Linepithema humile]|uniref:uncharacterized protein isoform X3 n=1 Tax=Linepithema humile TaxID=83485 RepID=UPI00351E0C4B